jgi:hypothetical protein
MITVIGSKFVKTSLGICPVSIVAAWLTKLAVICPKAHLDDGKRILAGNSKFEYGIWREIRILSFWRENLPVDRKEDENTASEHSSPQL